MIWDIIGLILSISSIVVSILCWKFTFSNIKKYNKYIKKLYSIDFSQEGSTAQAQKLLMKIYNLEKSIIDETNMKTIEFSKESRQNEKVDKRDFIACLYNTLCFVWEEQQLSKNKKKHK